MAARMRGLAAISVELVYLGKFSILCNNKIYLVLFSYRLDRLLNKNQLHIRVFLSYVSEN